MHLLWMAFWVVLSLLLVVAAVRLWARMRRRYRRSGLVDDDAVRRIVEDGVLATEGDEPLDLEGIEEEERRFWEETWDEAEEW